MMRPSVAAEFKRFSTERTEERWRKIGGRLRERLHRRDAEGAEKGNGESGASLKLWRAGAQQAAPLPLDILLHGVVILFHPVAGF